MLKTFLISCLFATSLMISAQNTDINQQLIESKASILLSDITDSDKKKTNSELKILLESELTQPNAFSSTYEELKSISVLTPPDSSFRLFSWTIAFSNGTYAYECLLLKRKNQAEVSLHFFNERDSPMPTNFSIVDHNTEGSNISNATVSEREWQGAHYYGLVQTDGRFTTYYTLLGWDGNDLLTDKKILEVLWFNKAGDIKLGAPVFKSRTDTKSRIIFEFGGQSTMKLFVRDERIIFDHLSPPPADINETTELEGIYDYYGPDLSFDGLEWQNGYWIYHSDIDADKGLKKKKSDFKVDDEMIKQKKRLYDTPSK